MSSSAESRHAQPADEHEASDRRPLLTIGRGWAIYAGPIEAGRLHRHQAAQLAWSKQGMLLLEGVWGVLKAPGHLLPAGVPHRLVAADPVRMVFLDPTMHSLCPTGRRPPATMAPSPVQADMLEDELDRWLRGAMPSETTNVSQPATEASRWASVLQWLETSLEGPVHVAYAADAVGLWSSRFMHWFAEASGLSFRAYVRWLRLQRAVRTLSEGCTLTEAAHLAGFADSAHLTRTFVSTFGIRPAPLRGAPRLSVRHSPNHHSHCMGLILSTPSGWRASDRSPTKGKSMKIGQLAHAASTTVETIRFYEQEGLLPAPARSSGNFRIYASEHVDRLAFIRHCRSLDMTLNEIRVLLRFKDAPDEDCGEVNVLLDGHIAHVEHRIQELMALERDLKHLRGQCGQSREAKDCGILEGLTKTGPKAPRLPENERGHVPGPHGLPGFAA